MSCFPVVTSILAGYAASDIAMALVLFQKNRGLFDQILGFFKYPEAFLLPLVVGTLVGAVTWYVLGELAGNTL